MALPATDSLQAGREAINRYAWSEAFNFLTEADASGLLEAGDLESLGEAAWWTGRLDDCIDARQRAYSAHVESGNVCQAAKIALNIAKDYFAKQASAVGSGWLNRAQRLLESEPEAVEHGYLERMRAVMAFEGRREFDKALDHAQRAFDIGARFRDRDLMAASLHDRGRILVAKGEVEDGLALMDEATVAAVGGELGPFWTAAIYCNMITSCRDLADYGRAAEWSDAAKRWCERQAIAGFPGMCRVYRAEIMRLRGAWQEAEQEARRACQELKDFNLGYTAEAFYEVGEIRLRMGDLAGAEESFAQAHELGRDPQPGLALLQLAQGKPESASNSIDRSLRARSGDRLARSRLLPAQVEVALASGDLETARTASDELADIARDFGSDALAAASASARGALELVAGDAPAALASLQQGFRLWQQIDAPYEAAQARSLLGLTHRSLGDQDAAALEMRAALSTFERLGALPDAKRVSELVGSESSARLPPKLMRTFMFTDIVKSTALVEAMGDDAWHDLVQWHDKTLRSLFASHGGHEVDHAGDGFFVAFDDAASAIECAVALQRKLADHRRTHGFSPQVRIGLHASEAVRSGDSFHGRGVHQAARIGSLAEGGQILVSRATLPPAGSGFPTSDPRLVDLKGISDAVEVCELDWR